MAIPVSSLTELTAVLDGDELVISRDGVELRRVSVANLHADLQNTSEKNQPNGYAGLDADGELEAPFPPQSTLDVLDYDSGLATDSPPTLASALASIVATLNGVVIGPASATDGGIVLFDGTSGKLVKLGTLTQLLDLVGSAAQGDILYRNASGWVRLAAGTSGHYLQTQGAGANPQWAAAAATGDVSGPVTSTNHAIATWVGTGGDELQDTGVIIDASNNVSGMNSLTLPNAGLRIKDTNASHDLIVASGSDLTSDRTLTVTTGDANRTLTLTGDASIAGTNTGDQTSVTGNAGTATALQTARNIDGVSFNGTADITVIAPGTHAASSKSTPVDADELPLVDSAASNVLKRLTWANLKATLKAYFDTVYAALGAITGSGLTMGTGKLLGRSTASTGAIEEITIGSGLSLSAGTLSATGGGDVTSSANLTDNALLRGDGGAKGVQTSGVVLSDADELSGAGIKTTTQTGDYTFVLADAGTCVEADKATALTFTVPPQGSVTWKANAVIEVVQKGAGQLTIAAGSGVTIRSDGGKLKLSGQWCGAYLRRRASDEWVLVGNIAL